jgi:pyridoxine 4-dehydrogenase
MKTFTFEKTFTIGESLTVNRLGFGAMRITGKGIWGQPENKQEAIRVIKRALDLGVNFIDTADSYGPFVSEELISEALFPYPAGLVIATKGGILRQGPGQMTLDGSPEHLKKALEGSLKRLKVHAIDLYQLHRIDPNVPADESFTFLKQAQQEGKIRHIGLSEVNVEDIKKAQQFFNVASVQNIYSVQNRKWENVLEYCKSQHIAFIPWRPLNAGNVEETEILRKIRNHYQASTIQIALSWLLQHSNNILLIPGTSSVAHLEENMKAASIILTDDELNEVDLILKAKREV